LEFLDARKWPELLSVEGNPALPFSVTGTADHDVLIIERLYRTTLQPSRGIRVTVVIECKKQVLPSHFKQIVTEAVLSELHSIDPIVAVLTDFNDYWHFSWFEERVRVSSRLLSQAASADQNKRHRRLHSIN